MSPSTKAPAAATAGPDLTGKKPLPVYLAGEAPRGFRRWVEDNEDALRARGVKPSRSAVLADIVDRILEGRITTEMLGRKKGGKGGRP